MRAVLCVLVALVACSVAYAQRTQTVNHHKLSQISNRARTQLIDAAVHRDADETAVCLRGIPPTTRELFPLANRCVCKNRSEYTFLERIPARVDGLNKSCRDPTPPPTVNVHDATLKLRDLCATLGTKQRWPFCILF